MASSRVRFRNGTSFTWREGGARWDVALGTPSAGHPSSAPGQSPLPGGGRRGADVAPRLQGEGVRTGRRLNVGKIIKRV